MIEGYRYAKNLILAEWAGLIRIRMASVVTFGPNATGKTIREFVLHHGVEAAVRALHGHAGISRVYRDSWRDHWNDHKAAVDLIAATVKRRPECDLTVEPEEDGDIWAADLLEEFTRPSGSILAASGFRQHKEFTVAVADAVLEYLMELYSLAPCVTGDEPAAAEPRAHGSDYWHCVGWPTTKIPDKPSGVAASTVQAMQTTIKADADKFCKSMGRLIAKCDSLERAASIKKQESFLREAIAYAAASVAVDPIDTSAKLTAAARDFTAKAEEVERLAGKLAADRNADTNFREAARDIETQAFLRDMLSHCTYSVAASCGGRLTLTIHGAEFEIDSSGFVKCVPAKPAPKVKPAAVPFPILSFLPTFGPY